MTALVYFGDGLWATRCLEKLLSDGHRALAVVGRSNPSDTSLQELAKARGITLLTPGKVNAEDFVERISALRPELNISMSYNQILRRPIIDTAPLGFINCHAGKLPRYRGRNVINWALINNETEIGLTIHYVNEGIDTGDIIL
ncbi:MAG: formyltransferase family protein [Alphaproteobacteria bacterium]